MPEVRFFLFGSPRLEIDGLPVRPETRKTVALLAYLGMTGESYRRDSLVNLLWPEFDVTHGRGVLRRTLASLNDILPEGWVAADRETIGLSRSARLWVDVNEFRRLLALLQRHPHPNEDLCPDCQEPLAQAAVIYREDFMSGFSLADSFNFDDWQVFQAEALRRELSGALKKLARCLALRADFPAAIEQARRRLALDRLDEDAHDALIRLYAWAGERSSALRQYADCKETLQQQLGVAPQAATTELWQAVEMGQLPAPPANPLWLSASGPTIANPASLPPAPEISRPAREEKRIMSVLACKVLPSARQDGTSLEEAQVLEHFQAQARPILNLYGGKIEHIQGGTVLIVFGLQRNRENSPELALRAVLEIRTAADQVGIRMSAGSARGEILIPPEIGGEGFRLSGSTIQDALHLSDHADSGQILAAESIYLPCRRTFEFSALPPMRRRSGPALSVHRVERLLPKSQLGRQSSPTRTRLVGREKELGQLRSAFLRLKSGVGNLVCLTGEAGMGKSRLVEELQVEVAADGREQSYPLWLEGRCLELSIDTAFWPFVDLLKQLFSWEGQLNSPCAESQMVALIDPLVTDGMLATSRRAEIANMFCRLLSPRQEDSQEGEWASRTPEELRQLTFLALRDFLVALARRSGLVLVFEDLHWADRLSLDLLSLLMESLDQVPIFLICIYRGDPEYRTSHLASIAARKCRDQFSLVNLSELARDQSIQLIRDLVKPASLEEGIQDLVWERCQGNPFFIEETLQSLINTGAMVQEENTWKMAAGFDSSQLPDTIQSIILGRLDQLEEDWRLILQTAAVIGFAFRKSILEKTLAADLDLDNALWELEGRGFIYQERAVPEVEFSFHHVLLQEAIYANILRHRRRMIHQRSAEAIEILYGQDLEEQAESLAYHSEKSGNIPQAVHYLYLAGKKARAIYSNEAAITHLTKGLEMLRSLPETMERNRRELEFLILVGVPLVLARGHTDPRVLAVYEDALKLCHKTGDETHLSEAIIGLRRYYLYRGPMRVTLQLSRQILELAEKKQDVDETARACTLLSETFFREGEFRQAYEIGSRGMELGRGLDPRSSISLYGNDTFLGAQCWIILALWHLGLADQARSRAEHTLERSKALSHPFSHAMVLSVISYLYILLQEPGTVQRLAEEELRISNERGFFLYQSIGALNSGWAHVALGREAKGLESIEKGLTWLQQMSFGLIAESEYPLLCDALLRSGQVGRCLEVIQTSQEAIERSGAREWEAELLRFQAEGLSRQGRLKEAQDSFLKAIHAARVQSSRGFELRAATGLARLWLGQGRQRDAKELLQQVYTTFTEGFDTVDLREAKSLLDRIDMVA